MFKKIIKVFICALLITPVPILAQESGTKISIPVNASGAPADIIVTQVSGEEQIGNFEIKKVDGDQNVELTLPEAGKYEFEVKITNSDTTSIKYDKTIWTVKANVFNNESQTGFNSEITITEKGKTEKKDKIEFKNTISTFDVPFSKTNEVGEFVAGFRMKIVDSGGNVVDSWTTDGNTHISKLIPGEYILSEESIPNGYSGSGPLRFRVEEDGKITLLGANSNFSIKDGKIIAKAVKLPNDSSKPTATATTTNSNTSNTGGTGTTTNTGDLPYGTIAITGFVLTFGILISLIKLRKAQNNS